MNSSKAAAQPWHLVVAEPAKALQPGGPWEELAQAPLHSAEFAVVG